MSSDVPPHQQAPVAWREYLAEGNARQARKRVGVDALIRDEEGLLVLVDPSYKPGWDLPGGMVEANESPRAALHRELKEELGLEAQVRALLCVDHVSPDDPWNDALMFIYDMLQESGQWLADLGDGPMAVPAAHERYPYIDRQGTPLHGGRQGKR